MNEDVKVLLVDSAHGVYSWHNLVTRYPLYVGTAKKPLAEYLAAFMPEETTGTVFHPDNEQWCENLDCIGYLTVQADDGSFWVVQQDEDIWAINPKAEWSDEENDYKMPD